MRGTRCARAAAAAPRAAASHTTGTTRWGTRPAWNDARRAKARGSPVVLAVLAVERERLRQPVTQRDAWLPSRQLGQPGMRDVDRPDVDLLPLRRPWRGMDLPALACQLLHQLGDFTQARRDLAADVQRVSVGLRRQGGAQERVDRVGDVGEVPQLAAVAEHLEVLALERMADERRDEPLAAVLEQQVRAVGVRQAQRGRRDAVDVVVEQVVGLARDQVDAVDVDRYL